jgi:hypothetical protein
MYIALDPISSTDKKKIRERKEGREKGKRSRGKEG